MGSNTKPLFPTLVVGLWTSLAPRAATASEWTLISEKDGISSYLRPIENEPIQAGRGVMTVDLPACRLISFYVHPKLATSWVDMLVDYQLVELGKQHSLVWQKYDMPWPVTDRDFLLDVKVHQPDEKTVVVTLQSTEDPRFPPPTEADGLVRGRMSTSTWSFTRISDSQTALDMSGHVDPRGNFPSWLMNLIQQTFPYNTLSAFVREAEHVEVPLRPECAHW